AQRIEDQIEVVFREPGICSLTCLLELAECVIALTEPDVDDREREGRNVGLTTAELQFLDETARVCLPARRPVCMPQKRKMHGVSRGEPGDLFESGCRGRLLPHESPSAREVHAGIDERRIERRGLLQLCNGGFE